MLSWDLYFPQKKLESKFIYKLTSNETERDCRPVIGDLGQSKTVWSGTIYSSCMSWYEIIHIRVFIVYNPSQYSEKLLACTHGFVSSLLEGFFHLEIQKPTLAHGYRCPTT
jgi:hypothetical protein